MLQLLIYASIIVFLSGLLYKFWILLKRMHLRCDLYPLPHVPRSYGNSKYENVEWWKKEVKKSLFGKLKGILGICILNRKKMSLQPKHWLATFLFHLGIFLHGLWIFFLIIFILVNPSTVFLAEEALLILSYFGAIGLHLMFIFALYLLIRKLRSPIRHYVPPEDYIILILVLIISSSGILAFLEVDHKHVLEVLRSLILLSEIPTLSLFETIHLFTFSILILIIPFTRIAHYIAVWFAHLVLWDDRSANKLKDELRKILKGYKVKWSANHLNPELNWEEEAKISKFEVIK